MVLRKQVHDIRVVGAKLGLRLGSLRLCHLFVLLRFIERLLRLLELRHDGDEVAEIRVTDASELERWRESLPGISLLILDHGLKENIVDIIVRHGVFLQARQCER
jgi:hypothetical protein